VFLEDLDLYASERGGAASTTLGELLSQMDGLESNDGVIVVATTNDLAAIEPALRERPSRFDAVIEIGLPETAARREILVKQWQRQRPGAELVDHTARATLGMSGAQVREAAILAIHNAIVRDSVDDAGLAHVEMLDIERGISQILGKPRRTAIGFRPGRRQAARCEPVV
jgi:cell division protease FtsH